jgi:iron(III) transport system permease protein
MRSLPASTLAVALGRPERRLPVFTLLLGTVVLVVGALVIYPIGFLLYQVFFAAGEPSASQIGVVFSDPELRPALVNTAILVVVAGAAALAIGATLAWLNERTDARLNWAADILPIIPLLVPSVAVAVGWVFLFAPRAGFVNAFLRAIFAPDASGTAASGPLDIYSLIGIVVVTVVLSVPYAYLVMAAALRNVDPALEEASRMSGRGPLGTFFYVTLPAVRNAIATTVAILTILIMAMFAAPVVIGLQAGIDVLSFHIFRVVYAVSPPRLAEGIILSSFMLAAAQLTVLIEYLVTRSGHHATVGGRAHGRSRTRLGPWRWPARAAMLLYFASATVLPVAALVLVSLQAFWTSQVRWDRLSLTNYAQLFDAGSTLGRGLTNSLILAVVTATVLMIVAAMIAFFIRNLPGPVASAVNVIATLPSSIPHTAVAIAFLVSLGVGQLNLQGSLLLLFLAYVVLFLPMASRAAGAAVSQVGKDLWESSLMSGASPLRSFLRVVVPLAAIGLLSGWVIVFAHSLGEVNAGVFLSGANSPVVGPLILQSWQINGNYSALAALTVCITVIQVIVVTFVSKLARGRLNYGGI